MKNIFSKIIHKFTDDHGSWVALRSTYFRLSIFKWYSGIFARTSAYFKGISLGKHCEFYGRPYFYRSSNSSITLGNRCRLRSDHVSNLIGVNHRCIISTLASGAVIKIGDNTGMSGASIGAAREIIIGANVLIGANCIITDNDWHDSVYFSEHKPVIIHDHAWIGVNCTILKGVEIGENSIIGAHSLVNKSIPANVVAAGNPCKVIKNLP
jgi:acetyltransferase-like isoleucine patch superfamily enzyme